MQVPSTFKVLIGYFRVRVWRAVIVVDVTSIYFIITFDELVWCHLSIGSSCVHVSLHHVVSLTRRRTFIIDLLSLLLQLVKFEFHLRHFIIVVVIHGEPRVGEHFLGGGPLAWIPLKYLNQEVCEHLGLLWFIVIAVDQDLLQLHPL